MEQYLCTIHDTHIQIAVSGFLLTLLALVYLNSSSSDDFEYECNRVVKRLSSVISGEFQCLRHVELNENPYDLFTRIYPTLKEMNNERVDEFIDILTNYNSNWVDVDDN
jgi:hypothetical protein